MASSTIFKKNDFLAGAIRWDAWTGGPVTEQLDYWAFLVYPESSSMSLALAQYLHSQKRSRIGFCMILHNALTVSDAQWPRERERAVTLMEEPGYQTVLGGRPLVYAFGGQDFSFSRFAEFKAAAIDAGRNPHKNNSA